MKTKFTFLFTLLIFICNNAQDFKLEKVTKDELLEKKHPIDSAASACYLFKKQFTKFGYAEDSGFYSITEFSFKIKIYKKDGLKYGTIEVPYYTGYTNLNEDKVDIKYGATYNLVGNEIVKTKLDNVGKIRQNYNQYWSLLTIVFPSVKEGSIIELKYILKSENIRTLPDFEYQEDIPVDNALFYCNTPVTYRYKTVHIGNSEIVYNEKITSVSISMDEKSMRQSKSLNFNQLNKEIIIKNIPKYIDEIYNEGSVKSKIESELEVIIRDDGDHKKMAMTWDDVAKNLYVEKEFGKYIKVNKFYDEILKIIYKDGDDEKTKMVKVFKYIKNHMNWNEKNEIFTKNEISKVFQSKEGNVSEINLMLLGFLKAAFLDAQPVVLSTREKIYFPSLDKLNYVIVGVKIENEIYLLDATDKNSEPNILPARCLKDNAWMLYSNATFKEIDINEKALIKKIKTMEFSITPEFKINGKLRNNYLNHSFYLELKENLNLSNENITEKLKTNYDIDVENYDRQIKDETITENYNFSTKNHLEVIGNKIYLQPLLFLFEFSNPFKTSERYQNINFIYKKNYKFLINIIIPEGYAIEYLPTTKNIAMPEDIGNFKYIVQNKDNKINIIFNFNLNKTIISRDYYEGIKTFYQNIYDSLSDKIVLKKL